MNKRIVFIDGSARQNGDTKFVIQQLNQHLDIDSISLLDYNIGHFDYAYANAGDDFISLMESVVLKFDTLIFVTPVYWYSMSGRMKVFFDRISDLLHYKKNLGRQLRGKKMAVISVSNADDLMEGFTMPFEASARYLGMHFLKSTHIWVENAQLSPAAQTRLSNFKEQVILHEA